MKKIIRYFKESRLELKKVVWPAVTRLSPHKNRAYLHGDFRNRVRLGGLSSCPGP